MIRFFKAGFNLRLFLGFLCISLLYCNISIAAPSSYHLDIKFLPEQQSLQGKATIDIPAGKEWQFYTGGLTIQGILLQEEGKEAFSLPLPQKEYISMYASNSTLQLIINYSLTIPENARDNLISSRGIVLTSNWHPLPQEDMLFSLRAELPQGFYGISESDTLPEQSANYVLNSAFSQAVRAINLAAGPYQVEEEIIREGLSLSTWFFKEDQYLSQQYLDAAKAYILRYEEEIGPFPYSHYAVVANRLPSGFGMPTFTLLGQMVLRLPFIKETSLGHEILHSWFGNSIEVAEDSGNWCEGLTSYLADFSYATDKGEGVSHRKAALINYQNYVKQNSAIALNDFGSASHHQAMAKAKRAVGYNRSAMMFHQLRGLLGPEDFIQGLRLFAESFKGRPASWQDIQTSFETVSKKDLAPFFTQQLTRNDVPAFQINNVVTRVQQDSSSLSFTLSQLTEKPYNLMVPIQVTTVSGTHNVIEEITEKDTLIDITLSEPPLSFAIDPEYNLFRKLESSEHPPVWSRFMGSENKLLVTANSTAKSRFAPFIKLAEQQGWAIVDDELVTNQQLSENSILFLSAESNAYRSLFGESTSTQKGFHLDIQNNPLNSKEVAILARSSSPDEAAAVLYKLKHYGKYSSLDFQKGRILKKEIAASDAGIEFLLETLPMGGATTATKSFEQIINELATKRVIYIGETHDSMADHLLQLRIIQGLQRKGLDLAIAMEMFPTSSQPALDKYLLKKKSKMDESEFLRESKWFEVWRYDWRLFRPIFNFCRKNSIPVYGINIDREIVSTVFSDGNTDTLSSDQLESIASSRNLAMDGYVERLQKVYAFHGDSPHGKKKKISGFVQSQAIWDESMAENIAQILTDNPQKTVVVIAGSQHTRKDSGIPPRLARRMNVAQSSVLNLYADNSPIDPSIQADYFFLTSPIHLETKGRIGIMLDPQKDDKGKEHLRISGISHAGKAKEAGLKENDVIVTLNDKPAKNMGDIGILMMDSLPGDILTIKVLRKDDTGEEQEQEIAVELSDLTKPANHP